eukprot:SAG11_NODE_30045_length_304_cov_3.887805_1_plen_34_part_10
MYVLVIRPRDLTYHTLSSLFYRNIIDNIINFSRP